MRNFISGPKNKVKLWSMTKEYFQKLVKTVWERIYLFFNPPPPYVDQYSLRTPEQHAAIRKSLKIRPATCPHRKGSGISRFIDYNVSLFTFIDGSRRIRCNRCGKKWYPQDEDWAKAMKMVTHSTNTPAASERIAPEKLYNYKRIDS